MHSESPFDRNARKRETITRVVTAESRGDMLSERCVLEDSRSGFLDVITIVLAGHLSIQRLFAFPEDRGEVMYVSDYDCFLHAKLWVFRQFA